MFFLLKPVKRFGVVPCTVMKIRNITRYTYERTAFQGWRLSICRNGHQFTRYFSDRQYGSEEAALQAALEMRSRILSDLKLQPGEPGAVFDHYLSS